MLVIVSNTAWTPHPPGELVVMESEGTLGKGCIRVINRLAKIDLSRMVLRSMCLCGACKRR